MGAGARINFSDLADKTGFGSTSIPLVGKLDFGFGISKSAKIGLGTQYIHTVWDNDRDVRRIRGVSGIIQLQYKVFGGLFDYLF